MTLFCRFARITCKVFLLVGFVLEGDVLKDVVNKGLLLDYYRPLLTEKQRYCMEQHYEHDLSLGEIAEELNISRQAVYDNLQRASQLLDEYEAKLHLVEKAERRQNLMAEIRNNVDSETFVKISAILEEIIY